MPDLTKEKRNALANELEEIILEMIEPGGFCFETEKIQKEWEKRHPDVEFKTPFSILFARNRVGMLDMKYSELRETWRTD